MKKAKYNRDTFKHLEILKKMRLSFSVKLSNYSCIVEHENGEKIHFLKEFKSERFFAIAKLIQKEVSESPNFQRVLNSDIAKRKAKYFENQYNILPIESRTAYNLDLNAAYPTALFNNGLISLSLYEKLMKLKKIDRLGAVGMLASTQNILYYENGVFREDKSQVNESEFKPIFNFLVNYVDELMIDLLNIDYTNFMFFWVDGIYFRDEPTENKKLQMHYLIKEAGFDYKIEILKKFRLNRSGDNIAVNYIKDGKEKSFLFPDRSRVSLKNYIVNNLNNK